MIIVREESCRGCGLCTQVCPQLAIHLESNRARVDHARCNECMACMNVCPVGAITTIPADPIVETADLLIDLRRHVEELSNKVRWLERNGSTTALLRRDIND